MITYADVEKLLATRSEDPPVLSLYLEMPLDLPALRGLPTRAGELLDLAAGGPCGPDGPDAERALAEARQAVRRFVEDNARDWLGHRVAIFLCGPADLAEAIPLPAGLGEQAVFGPRPHVRPLLVALQRHPAYRIAVVNRRHAWLSARGGRPDRHGNPADRSGRAQPALRRLGRPAIAPDQRAHRRTRAPSLPRHRRHPRSGHSPRAGAARGQRPRRHHPQFLAMLPPDLRDRFAGSFVEDTFRWTRLFLVGSSSLPVRGRVPRP